MNPKTILLIDDDLVVTNIYQTKLLREGYQVQAANDGERALAMLKQAAFDLVVLDLSMPGINGVEVLKHIRSQPDTRALPVIVFSNAYQSGLVQAAWKAGISKCLTKADCTPRQMLEAVRELLAASTAVPAPASTPVPTPAAADPAGGRSVQTDMESQAGMVRTFLRQAPDTLAKLRQHHHLFSKQEQANLRMAELFQLFRLARSLTGAAGLVGFRRIAQMSSALEALLLELHTKPKNLTPSALRTVAQSLDTLALLITHAANPHTETPRPPLLLVVDDEIVSREMICLALGKAGLRAISLDDSSLALRLLEQNHFDLIFLDVEMPGSSGLDLCARIRQMPANRDTPVVFVTARSDFDSRVRTSVSGGNDFISKPFLLIELAVRALTWLFREELRTLAAAGAIATGPAEMGGSLEAGRAHAA